MVSTRSFLCQTSRIYFLNPIHQWGQWRHLRASKLSDHLSLPKCLAVSKHPRYLLCSLSALFFWFHPLQWRRSVRGMGLKQISYLLIFRNQLCVWLATQSLEQIQTGYCFLHHYKNWWRKTTAWWLLEKRIILATWHFSILSVHPDCPEAVLAQSPFCKRLGRLALEEVTVRTEGFQLRVRSWISPETRDRVICKSIPGCKISKYFSNIDLRGHILVNFPLRFWIFFARVVKCIFWALVYWLQSSDKLLNNIDPIRFFKILPRHFISQGFLI